MTLDLYLKKPLPIEKEPTPIPEDFMAILAEFERARITPALQGNSGIAAQRGEHYKFPAIDAATRDQIDADKQFICGLPLLPDDVFEIPIPLREEGWEWKPLRIETYGLTRSDLEALASSALNSHKLLKIASVHGASHSFAMLIKLVNDFHVPLDFCIYVNVPNELPAEKAFVLYYARYLLKQKVVIVIPQDTAEEFYYRAQLLPKTFARWCTRRMKLMPFKRFLEKFFFKPKAITQDRTIDIVQFLGMQRFQSSGRSQLPITPTISALSYFSMRVFDMLPILNLSHDDDLDLIQQVGGIRSFNERLFGRHGCLCCPFATWDYYFHLQQSFPELYAIALRRRDCASQIAIEKGRLTQPWTQYRLNKEMKKKGLVEPPF